MQDRSIIMRAALAVVAAALGAAAPAAAGDYNGNFMVRLQGTEVITQDKAHNIEASTGGAFASIPGADAKVSDEFIPSATLTYFLNKNIAIELFCCAAKVDVKGSGALAPFGKIADTWIFPPVLTLQYHLDPVAGFKPYVGAGIEYIHYFSSKSGNLPGSVDFSDSWGFALQAGLDYQLGNGWYANVDVKKIWLDTDVTWHNPLGAGTTIRSNVDVDPLIISAGVGYRFNLEDLFGSRVASAPAPLK